MHAFRTFPNSLNAGVKGAGSFKSLVSLHSSQSDWGHQRKVKSLFFRRVLVLLELQMYAFVLGPFLNHNSIGKAGCCRLTSPTNLIRNSRLPLPLPHTTHHTLHNDAEQNGPSRAYGLKQICARVAQLQKSPVGSPRPNALGLVHQYGRKFAAET